MDNTLLSSNITHSGGHEFEIALVIWQQETFPNYDYFYVHISDIANPRTELLYFSPFIFYFILLYTNKKSYGLKPLSAMCCANFINLMLKFICEGDRPYWVSPHIREFIHTCESGYGMPSGHVMGTTCFVVFTWELFMPLLRNKHDNNNIKKTMLMKLLYILMKIYMIISPFFLFFVAQSRVHTGSHFPSQVVLGAIGGGMVHYWSDYLHYSGWWVEHQHHNNNQNKDHKDHDNEKTITINSKKSIFWGLVWTSVVIIIPISVVYLLETIGRDPHGSIEKAKAGCANSNGVKSVTAPIQTIAGTIGLILGVSLGLPVLKKIIEYKSKTSSHDSYDHDNNNNTNKNNNDKNDDIRLIIALLQSIMCVIILYILSNYLLPIIIQLIDSEPLKEFWFFFLMYFIGIAILPTSVNICKTTKII